MSTATGVSLNKGVGLVLLVAGVVLLTLGVIESESVSSDFSRLFTGQPTDKTVWLIIGGGVALVIGLVDLARSSR